jgi:hypothetical protein
VSATAPVSGDNALTAANDGMVKLVLSFGRLFHSLAQISRNVSPPTLDHEQRPEIPRRNTHVSACVMLDGGFAKRPCTILDISDTGARVQFSGPAPPDASLHLTITGDVRHARASRIIWRRGRMAGLQFVSGR